MPEFNPTIHCYLRKPNNKGKANLKNLVGQRFNRLLVFSFLGMTDSAEGCRESHWLCRCDCGKWWTTTRTRLRNTQSQSCGCWNYDKRPYSKTHGLSKTLTYRIWSGIITRTTNTNHHSYSNYGERGITVCEGMRAFADFHTIVGEPPEDRKSIDRWPDNNGGYWCGECNECTLLHRSKNWRWANPKEQRYNQRICRPCRSHLREMSLEQLIALREELRA